MTKHLLQKHTQRLLWYAVIITLITAPVFYFIVQNLYIEDADETLLLHKKEFDEKYLPHLALQDIEKWNRFNRDTKILPYNGIKKDSLFYIQYLDTIANEMEPYRELNVPVKIQKQMFTYSAKVNLIETEDLIQSIVVVFFIILSSLLLGFYFIYKNISQKIWQPFYNTLNLIEQFEIDKANPPPLPDTDIDEFSRLNQSIHNLIRKNILIYQTQKEFFENAAHELQTPLAVIQSKIDALIQTYQLTPKQYTLLQSINESIAQLNKLNKNLLLLSKLDNNYYYEKEKISIKEILLKNKDFFEEQSRTKKILTTWYLDEDIQVLSNAYLTEILLNNILINAIKHNRNKGNLIVKLENPTLTVANTGTTAKLNKEKLFFRFTKMNTSNNQGNGLGLAIVKKIADNYNWTLEYKYDDPLHVFQIHF